MAEKVEAKTEEKVSKAFWYARLPLLLLFIAALAWGGILYYRWTRGVEDQTSLIKLHALAVKEDAEEEDIKALEAVNSDYIGWLTVYGSTVDHPVVQGEDDTYYLDHDFYGRPDSSGCLFAYSGVDPEADGNVLIIGHNMINGTMFGGLKSYLEEDFFGEHGAISLDLGDGDRFYEIFAMMIIPGDPNDRDYFPVEDYLNDISEDKAAELLSALRGQALLWRDIQPDNDDRFLFLKTADYTEDEGCLLLCARRLGD